mgnify:FL=1|jgi:hypothetical protein|tara:strand:+ start:425 stop:1102 length:678 start_codon:yes stop_codon:yes gene_type:complete
MATSGTSAFNLEISEVIEEAFERCGLQSKTGYDIETARRSLNLLSLEWVNRGLNFWTVEQGTKTLTAGTSTVTMDSDTVDLIQYWIRDGSGTSQSDLPISRFSVSQYSTIPNKLTEGRPVNLYIDKQRDAPVVYFWPTPNKAYTFAYQQIRRIEDTGSVGSTDPDVPARFLPALVSGLAYMISQKYPEAAGRSSELKAEYEFQWQLAEQEDRDRASVHFVPGGYS